MLSDFQKTVLALFTVDELREELQRRRYVAQAQADLAAKAEAEQNGWRPSEPKATEPVEESLRSIAGRTAAFYGCTIEAIRGKKRHAELVWPRFVFCYLAYCKGVTRSETGRFLNRDHASVIHGISTVKNECKNDHDKREKLRTLATQCGIVHLGLEGL